MNNENEDFTEAKAAIEDLRARYRRGEVSGAELDLIMKGAPRGPLQLKERVRALLYLVPDDAVRERCLEIAREVEGRQKLALIRKHAGMRPLPHPGWHLAINPDVEGISQIISAIAELYCSAGILPYSRVRSLSAGLLLEGVSGSELAVLEQREPDYVLDRPVDPDLITKYVDKADGGLLFIGGFHRVTAAAADEILNALVHPMEYRQETLAIMVAAPADLLARTKAINPSFSARIRTFI